VTAERSPFPGPDRAPDLETEWSRAVKAIDEAAEICLACHIRPDGDALGSMLAVAQALRVRSAADRPPGAAPPRVIASFGELPLRIPRILRFLPGTDLLTPPDAVPSRPQVMMTFDAASADRLGMLEANAARAAELIVLDHHASNTSFGTVNLIDPAAAATAVLAHELIGRLGVPVSRDIALGLYAGLVTDTGSFRYSNTSPGVHLLAASLLETGIDPGGVAHGLPFEAAESVIDVLRRTDEADVAVVLKEDDDGLWQVSARAKGAADVGRACVALGGGGHPKAAGFTAQGPAADVMAALRHQLAADSGP
jgi:bifunctional oligoribonuclease and PAP phosphatase NrnA